MAETITDQVLDWIVARIEGLTPDDAFDANDQFRHLEGLGWAHNDGDHRNFDLVIATLESADPTHALANKGKPTFNWPVVLVVRYVVPLHQLERVRRMVLSDATQIVARLEDEAAWPAIQGTSAGSLVLLRARLGALGGNQEDNAILEAFYDLDIEIRRNME